MSQPIIRIESLGKQYTLGAKGASRTLGETISHAASLPFRRKSEAAADQATRQFWALKDVTLDISAGEVVGVIGRNGAGKSTLLKILSRITEPTVGRARIRGRLASLLEVGTGFHGELSGRENIFLNGAILGMTREEIRRKFDDIVEFAEIERFLDTAVKRYSSGMYVRLAFAVAAHLEPEILIVDEVLAVGDHAFQQKCMRKMHDVGQAGRTVILVSHNMAAIRSLCDRAICLTGGTLSDVGTPREVIERYIQTNYESALDGELEAHPGRWPGRGNYLRSAYLFDDTGRRTTAVAAGGELVLSVRAQVPPDYSFTEVFLGLNDSSGDRLAVISTQFDPVRANGTNGDFTATCRIPHLPLVPGRYSFTIWIEHKSHKIDAVDDAAYFEVLPGDFFGSGRLPEGPGRGKVLIASKWSVARIQ